MLNDFHGFVVFALDVKDLSFPVQGLSILGVKAVKDLADLVQAVGVPLKLHVAQTLVQVAAYLELV